MYSWLSRAVGGLEAALGAFGLVSDDVSRISGRFLHILLSAEFVWTMLSALLISTTIIAIFICLHWIIAKIRRPTARIFISYQNTNEKVAEDIRRELAKHALDVHRIPYDDAASHDSVILKVANLISNSDLLLAIPSNFSSFVEHEIAEARGAKKPICIAISPGGTLPNTARKGYPVLAVDRIKEFPAQTSEFFSYLCNDARSVGAIYSIIFTRLIESSSILVVLYVSFGAALRYGLIAADGFVIFAVVATVLLTLSILTIYFGSRFIARSRAIISIRDQRFDLLGLPDQLTLNLDKQMLRNLLVDETLYAHHERTGDGKLPK